MRPSLVPINISPCLLRKFAACVIRLAERYRSRFILVGRSALEDEPAWAAGVTSEAELKQQVTARIQLGDLSAAEGQVLSRGLEVAKAAIGKDPGTMTAIVTFRDNTLRGLHKAGEILIARKELENLGQFVVTLLHEYSHEFGSDGAKDHVDALQCYMEKIINAMEEKK